MSIKSAKIFGWMRVGGKIKKQPEDPLPQNIRVGIFVSSSSMTSHPNFVFRQNNSPAKMLPILEVEKNEGLYAQLIALEPLNTRSDTLSTFRKLPEVSIHR